MLGRGIFVGGELAMVWFSSKLLRRGLEVFGAGALVMAVTCILLPEDRVVFGVLTLIGSCMLLMVPLRKLLDGNGKAAILFIVFAILFILFKDVNYGEIGIGMLHRIIPAIPKLTIRIPKALYANIWDFRRPIFIRLTISLYFHGAFYIFADMSCTGFLRRREFWMLRS